MGTRNLILGLDGLDLDLILRMGNESLPTFHRLMEDGAFARLESVQPPATLPNWTTFLTGVDPGRHGVFDFTTRHGYGVRFTGGTVREVPTMMARLDELGLSCCSLGFPGTWPPERLRHGVMVSGWDAPVASEASDSFVWPPSLYARWVERFGVPRFDDVNEFSAEEEGWHSELPNALCRRISRRVEQSLWLLKSRPWDLFAAYFGESDTASHYLWSLFDADSPRRPSDAPRFADQNKGSSGLEQVYRALDEAVGEIQRYAPDAELTIASDHGSGGSSRKIVYLNRALAEHGLLQFKGNVSHADPSAPRHIGAGLQAFSTVGSLSLWARDQALTMLSPALRDFLFRAHRSFLPNWLESRVRFGAIDMTNTVAFSEELNYFPSVHLNLRGREPRGTVDPTDLERTRQKVIDVLENLRDPWTQARVVRRAVPREELFDGPWIERAPDLLLDLNLDDGYSYNLMPSGRDPNGPVWSVLQPREYLGRKGRSLPGSHRSHGVLIMHGPQVIPATKVQAHIADATATILARMNVGVPSDFSGRILWEALHQNERALHSLPSVDSSIGSSGIASPPPLGAGIEAVLEARLRSLGYVDS